MQQANQKKDTIDGEDEGILLLFLGLHPSGSC
jgi:hypothetical protein